MANSAAGLVLAEDLVVPTHSGFVKGVRGPGLMTWRGIPYGKNTGGKYRFRAPRPMKKWQGVRDCSTFGEVAPQPTYSWTDKIRGSEDCLNLDIVRPDTEEPLPVVVYLHGGSYIMGASSEKALRGYNLVKDMNVVYVAINFRLGALGYLDLRSVGEDCVANPALHDQLLALKWIRQNIEYFG
ncbi:MAG: carboxylesterase/lipase family protein, partial [Corynebacterium sp.]|nr:carboxylesterase/lipase family protein [Corynebacterium sp.]